MDEDKKAVLEGAMLVPDAGPTSIRELERIASELESEEDRRVLITAGNEILRLRIIQIAAELAVRDDG